MASRLKVYYGFARANKVRKERALSVIFENDTGYKNSAKVKMYQETAYIRNQTEKEAEDADHSNRCFTEYGWMLDKKPFNGNIDYLLEQNYIADENNVSEEERKQIKDALKRLYKNIYPNEQKKEFQLTLF